MDHHHSTSALRPTAPSFIPASAPCNGEKKSSAKPRRRKKKNKKKQNKKNRIVKDENEAVTLAKPAGGYLFPALSQHRHCVAETSNCSTFATILQNPVANVPTTPEEKGWTILRHRKQRESLLPRELPVVTPPPTKRRNLRSDRIHQIRSNLWESMDRIQQEKLSIVKAVEKANAHVVEEDHANNTGGAFTLPEMLVEYATTRFPSQRNEEPQLSNNFSLDVDDETLLKNLPQAMPSTHEECMRCLVAAVRMDRPQLVRLVCSRWTGNGKGKKHQRTETLRGSHPMIMAAAMGHDECLQILLSTFTSLATIVDSQGNTVLHIASGNLETFRLVFQHATTPKTTPYHTVWKLLSHRNHYGQTFLHVAETEVVDWVLQVDYRSSVSKLLQIQDNKQRTPLMAAMVAGATDVVMNILMRGGTLAPLRFAVQTCSADMVALVLEFPTDDRVDAALYDGVIRCEGTADYLHVLQLLVEAGANPFGQQKKKNDTPDSAFLKAVQKYDADAIVILLETHEVVEMRRRDKRRKDPKLKLQPESFFAGLEATANTEKQKQLQQGLLLALYPLGGNNVDAKRSALAALALYERGATLDSVHLELLRESLRSSVLHLTEAKKNAEPRFGVHNGAHVMCTPGYQPIDWRQILPSLPWFSSPGSQCTCKWIGLSGERVLEHDQISHLTKIVVRSEDGNEFLVHAEIFDEKCEKLAGAVRFSAASHPDKNELVEIQVSLSTMQCRLLLEHLYYGSMLTPFPRDKSECCEALLELCLVADEYLCWSLLEECETRLLATTASCRECICSRCLFAGNCTIQSRVHQNSTCSFLVVDDTALTVMALTSELRESYLVLNEIYKVASRTQCGLRDCPPMHALRELALNTLISSFGSVVAGSSWLSRMDSVEGTSHTDLSTSFLCFCLQELRSTLVGSKAISNRTSASPSKKSTVT